MAPLDVPRLDPSAPGAGVPAGAGAIFTRIAPRIGDQSEVRIEARSVIEDPPNAQQLTEYESRYTVEVLETRGPAPSRVRLVFAKNVQRYQGIDRATEIDGKTYEVALGASEVRGAGGVPVTSEESKRVLDAYPDLGLRAPVDQTLPDGPMPVGEARDGLAAALLRLVHPRAWALDAGQATLARVEGEEAIFAVTLRSTSQLTGMKIAVEGEAHVRLRDTRLVGLTLDGKYTLAEGDAEGTFHYARTVTAR